MSLLRFVVVAFAHECFGVAIGRVLVALGWWSEMLTALGDERDRQNETLKDCFHFIDSHRSSGIYEIYKMDRIIVSTVSFPS